MAAVQRTGCGWLRLGGGVVTLGMTGLLVTSLANRATIMREETTVMRSATKLLIEISVVALAWGLVAAHVEAQGKGEGGIVVRDDAPIYSGSKGTSVLTTKKRGDFVAGVTTAGIMGKHFQFEEDDARVHVLYFNAPKQSGMWHTGWMDPADVARFLFDCGCDRETTECRPYSKEGFSNNWNPCFKEARDIKLAELNAKWAGGDAANVPTAAVTQPPAPQQPTEKPLTNDDVVSLVKLDLGDDLVVSKIQQAPTESLDVSTDALVKLKGQGVGKAVLDAMIKRVAQRK